MLHYKYNDTYYSDVYLFSDFNYILIETNGPVEVS